MDTILSKTIVEFKVPFFGKNLKNKSDSRSCMFDVRRLLHSPLIIKHVGKRMAQIVKNKCSGKTLIGIATSGLPWATITSVYTNVPMLYVRKKIEEHMSNKLIEGILPEDKRLILIDDLLFAGESKRQSIEIIKEHGYEVTDIIVIVDRQLQRKKDGLPIQEKYGVKLHSLIKMEEIVECMIKKKGITKKQLKKLIDDYRRFERWDMPKFVQ